MSDVGVVGSVEPEVLARLLAETDHGQDAANSSWRNNTKDDLGVHTLSRYGWHNGDISSALDDAIAAAVESGGGIVQLPSGALTDDTAEGHGVPGQGITGGVMVRGSTRGATRVTLTRDATHWLKLGSDGAPFALQGSGVKDLRLTAANGGSGCGVWLAGTFETTIENVLCEGFVASGGVGLLSTGDNEHASVRKLFISGCDVAADCSGAAQWTCTDVRVNGCVSDGFRIRGGSVVTWISGLLQNAGGNGIHLLPGDGLRTVWLGIHGPLWIEGSQFKGAAFLKGEATTHPSGESGFVQIYGMPLTGTTSPGFLIDLDGYQVQLVGGLPPSASKRLKLRRCTGEILGHTLEQSKSGDIDVDASNSVTWVSAGSIAHNTIGPPPIGLGEAVTDGMYWATKPNDQTACKLIGVLGESLTEVFLPSGTWHSRPLQFTRDRVPHHLRGEVRGLTLAMNSPRVGSLVAGALVFDGTQSASLTHVSPPLCLAGASPYLLVWGRFTGLIGYGTIFGIAAPGANDGALIYTVPSGFVGLFAGAAAVTTTPVDFVDHFFELWNDGRTHLRVDGVDTLGGGLATLRNDMTAIAIGAAADSFAPAPCAVRAALLCASKPSDVKIAAAKYILQRPTY